LGKTQFFNNKEVGTYNKAYSSVFKGLKNGKYLNHSVCLWFCSNAENKDSNKQVILYFAA
jgi:hypothetical protein